MKIETYVMCQLDLDSQFLNQYMLMAKLFIGHKKIRELSGPGMIANDMPKVLDNFLLNIPGEIYEESKNY